jgi:hypothetical protein
LEPIFPGSELPGGLVALHDGRGRKRDPVWLPEQKALVFADALTAPEVSSGSGPLPGIASARCPRSAPCSSFPSNHVIVSHGEPVHGRADYERALDLEPWSG